MKIILCIKKWFQSSAFLTYKLNLRMKQELTLSFDVAKIHLPINTWQKPDLSNPKN
jgi:hypothetical protein